MRRISRRRARFIATRFVAAGGSSAVLAVAAINVATTTPLPVSYNVAEMVAIIQSSDTVGFADSQLYGETTAQIAANLDELQSTGSTTVRIDIPWAGVEPLPGTYDWSEVDAIVSAAQARGLAIDADINSTPYYATISGTPPVNGAPANPAQFATFAGQVAARYAGQISSYEIYNEPNSAQSFQANNPALVYTQLLQAAYPAIKAADPKALVVAGALGSVVDFGNITVNPVEFLTDVYADGGKGYFDVLSFHPYSPTLEFSQGTNVANSALQQLTALRQLLVANGDSSKLIWATEYGLETSQVSQQTQATFISDFLNSYSGLSYVGPSFIYTVQQTTAANTADPSDTYGVFNVNGTPTPAEQAIAAFIAAHPVTTTPPVVTPPVVTPPVVTNPGAAFAAALAAFYQQVIQAYVTAYLTALSHAFATPATTTTTPQTATAVTTVTAKALVPAVSANTVSANTVSKATAAVVTPAASTVTAVTSATTPSQMLQAATPADLSLNVQAAAGTAQNPKAATTSGARQTQATTTDQNTSNHEQKAARGTPKNAQKIGRATLKNIKKAVTS